MTLHHGRAAAWDAAEGGLAARHFPKWTTTRPPMWS